MSDLVSMKLQHGGCRCVGGVPVVDLVRCDLDDHPLLAGLPMSERVRSEVAPGELVDAFVSAVIGDVGDFPWICTLS